MTDRRQLIFDTCAAHLLKQNQKNTYIMECDGLFIDRCVYFNEGLRCGASPLLRDDLITNAEFMNQYNAGHNINQIPTEFFKSEFTDLTSQEIILARAIQNIHDNKSIKVSEWKQELKNLAIKENLEWRFDEVQQ